ncbi:toxin-antitoxin system TumE family protein [Arhodomonas sp. AD133]|uniref:toxin-antitoxin system TumE family protein n=1 Tax=Arhodomonas sp. AD133 TaxID=3415009 RepID=UPI003EB711E1
MKAELLLRERHVVAEDAFVELRVWRVPKPVRGSNHDYKYALVYVVAWECVLRYDNEAGKGDHKHIGDDEVPYHFTTPAQLLTDFWADVDQWRRE